MIREEIIIVGGGPIGLLNGLLLLNEGLDVTIYEEDQQIGYPQHCTGIVSRNTLDVFPVDMDKLVVNRYYGVIIEIGGEPIVYRASTPRAYIINRVVLEKELAQMVIDMGGRVFTGKRIDYKELVHRGASMFVIDAGGVKSLVKKGYGSVLPAIQVDVRVDNEVFNSNLTKIIVDKRINSEYFMWISPYKDGVYRVGTASGKRLKEKILTLAKNEGVDGTIVNIMSGLVITGGPIKKFVSDNVVCVGDAAGMAKATTGGGLYYGAMGAYILAEAILENSLDMYQKRWMNRFGKEIMLQKLIREIFINSSDGELKELFDILDESEVFNTMLSIGNMDFHASSLLKLLRETELIRYILRLKNMPGVFKKMLMEYI